MFGLGWISSGILLLHIISGAMFFALAINAYRLNRGYQ